MGNLTIATTFIVLVNVLMWFSAIAMLQVNPAGTICYTTDGSIIAQSTTGDLSVLDNDVLGQLPESQGGQINVEDGFQFTDIFDNILNWFKSAPGVKYVYGVVAAPYNVLKCMNLPNEFVVGLGTFWYLISFLVLVGFMWGRE